MSCVDAGRTPGLFFPAAWASRCYLHVFGLTSDSFPSEQFPPSTNNLGREHSKSHVGLAQVLLILAVMVIPSAVQALEDWRKSLNWRWLVPIAPIVSFATLPELQPPLCVATIPLRGESMQTGKGSGAGAHRSRRWRVPVWQAPPCERLFPTSGRSRGRRPHGSEQRAAHRMQRGDSSGRVGDDEHGLRGHCRAP